MDWAYQLEHGAKRMPGKKYYKNEGDLIKEVKTDLENGFARAGGRQPQILVIGALGRCGGGALDLCRAVGIPESNLLKWDLAETKSGGPFVEIRESDVFINCIYLSADIPKFITEEFLKAGSRRLSVVCDVSCDTTNPMNPIPFCNEPTSFDEPTKLLPGFDPPLSYITIDHLPSLLPREASEAFSAALLPSLLELKDRSNSKVWYVYPWHLSFQFEKYLVVRQVQSRDFDTVSGLTNIRGLAWRTDADIEIFVGRKRVNYSRKR